jgi:hypothetical protein
VHGDHGPFSFTGPDAPHNRFQPDAMLIHCPEFPLRHVGMGITNLLDQVGQFFFQASWASGSAL